MTDEELREFAKEQAEALGMPEVAAGLTAAFFYVRAQERLETARACAEECDKEAKSYVYDDDAGYGAAACASAIRAKFGVE